MEALLMEQMSYGGGGAVGGGQGGQGVPGGGGGGGGLGLVHSQGDYASMNWFDGMLSALHGDLGSERSPHSSSSPYVVTDDVGGVVDVSANSVTEQHHSPTDSSYNDGSLSSLESSSSVGGIHAHAAAAAAAPTSTTPTIGTSIVNEGWVDVGTGSLYSSGGEFVTPLAPGGGFGGRPTGTGGTTPQQLYSTVAAVVPENPHVHLSPEQQHQEERKSSFQQQEILSSVYGDINAGKGRPIKTGLPQCAAVNVNEGSPTSNFSRDGSVPSSINRSRGVTNNINNINGESHGGSQLANPGAGNVNNSGRGNFVESPQAAAHALEFKSSSTRHRRSQQQQQHPHQRKPTAEVWSNRPGAQQQQQQRQYHAHQLQHHHQHHPQQQLQLQQQQEVSQLQQSSERPQQQQQQQQPEDSGLWLVHSLVSCAQFIHRGDVQSAKSALMKINQVLLSAPPHQQQLPAGPMNRVASYFADALTQRIYGNSPSSQEAFLLSEGLQPGGVSELLHVHFYEMCPYLKFAHFTANQAILEACKGAKYVHVIDFNLSYGLQWPPLIQALALRHGGPPILRLTGIGPPAQGEMAVNEIGKSLAQLANGVKVQFQFRGVLAYKLNDIKPWMLQVHPDEVVVVNSTMQLHKLLCTDEPHTNTTAGLGEMLRVVRNLNPKIFTVAEQEANHNCPNFLDRFIEALHFYSAIFDSIEASNFPAGSVQQTLAEMHLGREISNILACEGEERVERHEPLDQWRVRLHNSGFQPIHLGLDAFKQASVLLTMFPGQGYRVEDNHGCLTLYWHARPLISASAWV